MKIAWLSDFVCGGLVMDTLYTSYIQHLTQFAYAASHDLQSPVRALDGLLKVLREDHYDQLDSEGRQVLDMALGSSARAMYMKTEILEYSRAGKSTEEIEIIDCDKLISTIEIDLKLDFEKINTRLNVGSLPPVKGKPTQLRRVFQNLISNALKLESNDTSDQQEIVIRGEREGQGVTFSIADSGIGMKQDQLKMIFDAFTQLHNKSAYGGVGLGLSVCQRIVLNHGGKIWAESEPGVGSTFFVCLPGVSTANV